MFKQGKKFEQNQKRYKRLIKTHTLNLISANQLNIVDNLKTAQYANIESMATASMSGASVNAVNKKNAENKLKLESLEAKFNTDMQAYIMLYKKYLTELVERQSNTTTLKNITVKYNGDYYYINKSGIVRQFTNESWIGKDDSCPDSSKTINNEEMNKLTRGKPMSSGEMCGISQMNVQDMNNGTAAWVDSMGQSHIYTSFIDRHADCPADVKKISSIAFGAIPRSDNYGPNDKCSTVSLDSPTYEQLVKLNQDLISTIENMKIELNNLLTEDKTIDNKVKEQKKVLVKSYNDLTEMNKKLRRMHDDIKQYEAEVNDQTLSVPSIQMHHLIWIILGGAFIATAVHNYRNL